MAVSFASILGTAPVSKPDRDAIQIWLLTNCNGVVMMSILFLVHSISTCDRLASS